MGQLLNQRRGREVLKAVYSLAMLMLGLLLIIPIVYMFSGSLKTASEYSGNSAQIIPDLITWQNYIEVAEHKYFLSSWYVNSIKIVLLTIGFKFLITVTAAYAFARLEFPLKKLVFMIALAVMLIPSDTQLIGRFLVYKGMGIVDSHWVLLLPAAADVLMLFMLRQFFQILPKELDESAILDGCNHFQIFTRIILPLAVPALTTMVLFTFIWTWNDYTNPFIFIFNQSLQTVSVGLNFISQTDRGTVVTRQLAGSVLVIFPIVILFAFTQKYFVQGVAMTGIKG